ncbi:hypothetical protein MSG28_005147 [Choristoneura fumiferana]|uniref:Uncharacterized protein n=1 Tax=Choristoneura fumiferana TaxID=7141 RepID=A0ACC0JQ44_CHOFU|nr:hypothetical protein MSG28_005147 [Choristoneura fumiferana]
MDSADTIIETLHGNIKTVKYNKPRRKNAIDSDMYQRVTRILNNAAKDDSVSVMVFTGTGDYFSSGNDLVAARDVHGPTFFNILHDFIEAFIKFPKLLVAIVNGPAVGIAVTTLPLCDVIFAAENALELLLFNQKMNAQEALDNGFVNYLYKPEDIQTKVWDKLMEISNVSDYLLTTTKRLMRGPIQDKLIKVNDEEIALLSKAWAARREGRENVKTSNSKL